MSMPWQTIVHPTVAGILQYLLGLDQPIQRIVNATKGAFNLSHVRAFLGLSG